MNVLKSFLDDFLLFIYFCRISSTVAKRKNAPMKLKEIRLRFKIKFSELSNLILSTYEGTRIQTIVVWVKRNQKVTAFATSALMMVQVFVIRYKNEQIHLVNLQLEKENSALKTATINKNMVMDDFKYPWWKKQASDGYFIIVDLNDAYEEELGVNKLKSLGKNNFQIVPYLAAKRYHEIDSVIASKLSDTLAIEPFVFSDSTMVKLLVWKGARRERLDTILEGFAIPLDEVLEVIKKDNN
ncbi:hypothetical protein Phi10:1_gp099 [Cellulophaga phage phi10:1]|uniref:Uncharacterized protein n=1 Tax=Cellulophaga phage phi10:1 TaxID=1327981 RepID=R9ZYL0_9CAUD|nr:hypothetical protein Phi10:1_gp099 [Cellulophaga phage phi10:1]AGO48439.1 hypothetical protein Phi10:1_gp099 [Cellulophaga phage phi10:1]